MHRATKAQDNFEMRKYDDEGLLLVVLFPFPPLPLSLRIFAASHRTIFPTRVPTASTLVTGCKLKLHHIKELNLNINNYMLQKQILISAIMYSPIIVLLTLKEQDIIISKTQQQREKIDEGHGTQKSLKTI